MRCRKRGVAGKATATPCEKTPQRKAPSRILSRVVARYRVAKTRQIVESRDDDPFAMISPVRDDRDFRARVARRLVERRVKLQRLDALALDMDVDKARNDVRRIGGTGKLTTSTRAHPKDARQLGGKFPFSASSFSTRFHTAHFYADFL